MSSPTLAAALLAMAAAFALPVAAQTAAQAAAGAEATPKKAVVKKAATKKPVSKSRAELSSAAAGLALATEVTEEISESQMTIASRVLTGTAQCEFAQTVDVTPMQDKPGHFRVAFKNTSYVMTPEETSTGAVRLRDQRNGVVWLQIPAKSMMMNQKVGQRMVDNCTLAEQRAAVDASRAAGTAQASLLTQ